MSINKAREVILFIKGWPKEFLDSYVTKLLYVALVNQSLNIRPQRIESVQKQFLVFCVRSLNQSNGIGLPSYSRKLALIKLPTLESHRKMLNFSFKVYINGNIWCGSISYYTILKTTIYLQNKLWFGWSVNPFIIRFSKSLWSYGHYDYDAFKCCTLILN